MPGNDDLAAELSAGLEALRLPTTLAPPLLAYVELLARWNKAYNLTSVRDPREMLRKHLLDSLAMQPYVDAGPLASARALAAVRAPLEAECSRRGFPRQDEYERFGVKPPYLGFLAPLDALLRDQERRDHTTRIRRARTRPASRSGSGSAGAGRRARRCA